VSITAVIFDVGNVLYDWNPRFLYERLIDDEQALDAFLCDVVTPQWHFQHDAGRPFAETSAELAARFPEHADLIYLWGPKFNNSIGAPVEGMEELVGELHKADVPLYAITNFSDEFWPAFRATQVGMFNRFRDVLVSGKVRLTKPDAAIYHLALDRFGLQPGSSLFIDDRIENVRGAEALGIRGHHFHDSDMLRAELKLLGLLNT
jgi:2-haloacid dehalogenase